MIYQIFKKQFGSKPQKLFDINAITSISDTCFIDGFGFLFLLKSSNCIGYVNNEGKVEIPWAGRFNESGSKDANKEAALFNFPSSISYLKNKKSCYIIENAGENIREISLTSGYVSSLNKSIKIAKYFSKIPNREEVITSCDVNSYGHIYWSVKNLHRCFKMVQSEMSELIGDGRAGFSVSNSIHHCKLSSPGGIKYINGAIYLADQNNHCIRKIIDDYSPSVQIIAGKPLETGNKDGKAMEALLDSPTKLKLDKTLLYFLDNGRIRYFSLSDNEVGTTFEDESIVSIDVGEKRELFIWQEVK